MTLLHCQESDDVTKISFPKGRFLWAVQAETTHSSDLQKNASARNIRPKQYSTKTNPISFSSNEHIYWIYEFSTDRFDFLFQTEALHTKEPLFFSNFFSLKTRVLPLLKKQRKISLHFSEDHALLHDYLPNDLLPGKYKIQIGYLQQSINATEFTIREFEKDPSPPPDDSF